MYNKLNSKKLTNNNYIILGSHGKQHLLCSKTVPATQGLGVIGRVGIIISHILTHDLGREFGNINTGSRSILGLHACSRFWIDSVPTTFLSVAQRCDAVDV